MTDIQVTLYTDGACLGNPGPGGWGALLNCDGHEKELAGGEPHTTNNRMELMAAIQGLEALKKPTQLALYTDSRYVMDGITKWIHGWRKRGWKTAAKQPVKNVDLWQRLDAACHDHEIQWQWVRGHSGVAGNERVDQLASEAALQLRSAKPSKTG